MKKLLGLFAFTAILLSASATYARPAPKVDVCHITGNGTYHMINVNGNAMEAHMNHGDALPGDDVPDMDGYTFNENCEVEQTTCEVSFEATDESFEGQFGETITPGVQTNEDCSTTDVLWVEAEQQFQQDQPEGESAGWAGWSCIEGDYTQVVGGGIMPADATIMDQGAAEEGAEAVSGFEYPDYPHYSFPEGEEGWVVEAAGPNPPESIYVLCSTE